MRTIAIILFPLLVLTLFASAQERNTQPQQRGVSLESTTGGGGGGRVPIPTGRQIAGKKYAVLVGVSNYQHMKNLSFTNNDVEALRDQLLAIGFDRDNIRTLVSSSGGNNVPTKNNIENAIKTTLERAEKDDLVVIFLSGHGIQPADFGPLFCPPDADRKNWSGTTVSLNSVRDDMGKCKASFKLLIVDACRNDTPFMPAMESNMEVRTIPVSHSSADKADDIVFKGVSLEGVDTTAPLENLTVFQSCSDGQVSWEDPQLGAKGHGLFTYYIIEALKGGAADDAGNIELMKLMYHTTRETLRHSQNDARMTEQRPKMFFNGNDFVLANIHGNVVSPALAARPEVRRLTTLDLPQQPSELPMLPSGSRRIDVATARELEHAVENIRDGDVVVLKPGVYTLSKNLNITRRHPLDKRTGEPIVFYGDPGDPQGVEGAQKGVQIVGDTGEPKGVQISLTSGRINITHDTPVYLIGLDISSPNDNGIQVDGKAADVKILFCSIRDCMRDGIVNRASLLVDSSVVTYNGNGFQSGSGGKSDVNNSRIAFNTGYGVTVSSTSKGRFSNNILCDNVGGNWRVLGGAAQN